MRSRFLFSGLLVVVMACWAGLAFGQELTTGAIYGTTTDPDGRPLAGVTVTITSAQGSKTVTTDAGGNFRFPYLIAGTYGLTAALHGYTSVERSGIEVHLSQNVRIEAVLTPGVSQKIEVVASAPVVDLTSTTTGSTISSSMMSSLPIGRAFSNTLDLAPGVVESGIDNSNPSIGGASGLENTYIVDGMSIGNTGYGSAGSYSIVYGSLGTGVNYDYIDEIQVKTGGYEPEYGEALGGYINLVTKSGGNDIHGSLFSYQQLSGLADSRVKTDRLNATFQPVSYASHDYGFAIGGPFVKDKVFWFAAFDPTLTLRQRATPDAAIPSLGFDHTLDVKRNIYNYAANVKWLVTPNQTLSFSAFGDPSVGTNGPQREESVLLSDPSLKYSKINYGGNNFVGHWDGQLLNNWFVEAMVAHHQDQFKEDPSVQLPQGIDYRPNAVNQAALQWGGVGFFENSTSKNTQYSLKLSNYLHAAGQHNLRYGIEYQNIGYQENPNYSGTPGIPIQLADGSIVQSSTGYQWDIPADGSYFLVNRIRSGPLGAQTNTHYGAAFFSDTWSPTDYLSIMAGVRNEQEKLIGTLIDHTWKDNWSPRFHVTVDPTRDNKTKVWGSYGRFFGKVPNDLAVRALSAETTYLVFYDLSKIDLSDPNNPRGLIPANQLAGQAPIVFGNSAELIDPNAKLSYEDEYVAGVQRELRPFLSASLSYMHRSLGRTMEDTQDTSYSAILAGHQFGNYIITNPGPPLFPKPVRIYDAVTFQIEKRMKDNWHAQASYTWSRLKGNYEGYFRRDNGQSDPFITSEFDFPYLLDPDVWGNTSATGVLPSDRTHVINLFGSYKFDFKLNVGLNFKAQSGGPITKLGYNQVYGNSGEIVLDPRGSDGRGPWTTNIGLHLDYPIDLGLEGKSLEVSLDALNLLNQQKGLNFDYVYENGGNVNPPIRLQGPPYNIAPCPTCINPDFAKATVFQDPRLLILSARLRF